VPQRGASGGDGKRYPLNMRTTKQVRERLEKAAAASGRSLAQEVEYRLERSFDREATMLETFGASSNVELIRALSMVLGNARYGTDREFQAKHRKKMEEAERHIDALYLSAIAVILAHSEKTLDGLVLSADLEIFAALAPLAIHNATNVHISEARQRALSTCTAVARRAEGEAKAWFEGRRKNSVAQQRAAEAAALLSDDPAPGATEPGEKRSEPKRHSRAQRK
jgi:hypothetical protein